MPVPRNRALVMCPRGDLITKPMAEDNLQELVMLPYMFAAFQVDAHVTMLNVEKRILALQNH